MSNQKTGGSSNAKGRPRRTRWGQSAAGALASAALTLTGVAGSVAVAASSPPSVPTTTPPASPAVPTVSPSITTGQDPKALLAKALALLDAETQAPAAQPTISSLRSNVTADAVAAAQAQTAAAAADTRSVSAAAASDTERANASSLQTALRQATLSLYMSGSSIAFPTAGLTGGDEMNAAVVGAQIALSPKGILAAHQRAVATALAAANQAQAAQSAAHDASVKVDQAMAASSAQGGQFQSQVATLPPPAASALTAEQAVLSQQAGQTLRTTNALQFTPTAPLPPPVATTAVALNWIFSELGKTYVYGATGPDTFDCSGLTQFVWNKAGVTTPRVAADQDAWSVPVPLSELKPGDLVFYGTTDIHHEGMYIGGGLMINAPHTGDVVRVSPVFYADLAGFGRAHGPDVPVPSHAIPTPATPATPAVVSTAGTVPSQAVPPPGAPAVIGPPTTAGPTMTTSVPTTSTTIPSRTTTTRSSSSTSVSH